MSLTLPATVSEIVAALLAVTNQYFSTRAAFVTWTASNTPSVGSIVRAGKDEYLYDGTSTDISDLTGYAPIGDVTFRHFGATGDGSTDDTTALGAAFDYAITNNVWLYGYPADTYKITSTITKTGQVRVDWRGAKWVKTTTGIAFEFTATTSAYDLSSDYTKTGTTLAVNDTGTALERGQPFVIVSDAAAIDGRDEGSNANKYRTGEYSVVGHGTTTTTSVALLRPLQKVTGVNPTSSAGEEATVDAYTTAYNARILVPDREERFVFKNFEGEYTDGHGAGSGDLWQGTFLDVVGYVKPKIHRIRQYRGYDASIRLSGTFWAEVTECYAERLENNNGGGQLGYGVSDAGYGTTVKDCIWVDCRHGYTTGASAVAADTTDTQEQYRIPSAVDSKIVNCRGLNFGDQSPFDTHHMSRNIEFESCVAKVCDGPAFSPRGRRIIITSPMVRQAKIGVVARTEYDSGDPDDDKTLNLKTAEVFTSAYVHDPDIEAEEAPFRMEAARLEVHGRCRLLSASHHIVDGDDADEGKGALVWGASGSFTTTDFDGSLSKVAANSTGVFYVEKPTDAAHTPAYSTSTVEILDGVDLDIDVSATNSTTIFGVDLDHDDVTFTNKGRLKFKLPSDGKLFDSNGTITTPDNTGSFMP